ncbi:MAG: hypothetical protein F4Z35_01015 [Dehalococcoidia bacterium]|nr:hypothetical protein [Dehalococcoidia bacterium]
MNHELHDSAFGSAVPLARELSPEIEKAVLQLVVDGFERWKAGCFTRVGDNEDHYTVRLVACMREIRRERNMALVPRFQHVEPSDEMLEGREDTAHAPRIDMVVSWDVFADDAFLSIECKRLAPDDLARLYVVEGIARFVRGYYGARDESGAMVGYIISGTPDAVLGRVNTYVERAQSMGPSHTLKVTDPIGQLHSVFASDHRRSPSFQPIRLTHLFFDMNGIGPPP